ncbi:hypothetical protein SDRG_01185 [Saprolegnia diclina VS20]|uniref:Uncharacterized protein n=1 Tax=Saprolegnia diclina (strain VS20) TaxID=1156394 RepID=T0QSR2_SAPDV|nr:hypothetical protein SDRG_01185 [Saprolegnia diclina VS20]EQC41209.1 hypothetical protein SDRG_01185 [Saprolegnia diclina VS20]|eukprot:XP_008604923.1 hypothetical protein SDRG_01185 [Saprolegnia diclina VS20]
MYYCGFYACVANHDGDASKCYPSFQGDEEWNQDHVTPLLKAKSDEINDCIDDGYLSPDDIAQCGAVTDYVDALARRNYICLAEAEIVSFLGKIYPTWNTDTDVEDDALTLVYARHLADERSYAAQAFEDDTVLDASKLPVPCTTNDDIYLKLNTALASLSGICLSNKLATPEPWSEPEPQYNGHYKKGPVYTAPVYKAT